MSTIPYIPWYPDAALSAEGMLTLEEVGALRILMDHMWLNDGWLPDNDKNIAILLRISLRKWVKLKVILCDRFIYENQQFTQKRILRDFLVAQEKLRKNSENGKIGGRKSAENRQKLQATAQAYTSANAQASGTASNLHYSKEREEEKVSNASSPPKNDFKFDKATMIALEQRERKGEVLSTSEKQYLLWARTESSKRAGITPSERPSSYTPKEQEALQYKILKTREGSSVFMSDKEKERLAALELIYGQKSDSK